MRRIVGLNLRGQQSEIISQKMKRRVHLPIFSIPALCVFLFSCEGDQETVMVEETRPKTSKDVETPRLFATSDERFRDTQPSPVKGEAPENWLALPASKFRILNYRFGESGLGEVYVSLSSGSVLENLNRWRGQFGLDALSSAQFVGVERIDVVGVSGVWMEASGEYGAGMGASAKPGYGIAGVIADVGGQILTVKMIGPEREVAAETQALRDYVQSLQITDK